MAGQTPLRSYPPCSDLGNLPLAVPSDVLRIGIVAAASFRYSPVFQWERPYQEKFSEDTLLSYRTQFKAAMQDDEFMVIVAEDSYKTERERFDSNDHPF